MFKKCGESQLWESDFQKIKGPQQISANWGSNSSFVDEMNYFSHIG